MFLFLGLKIVKVKVKELLSKASQILKDIPNPRKEAELLLAHSLDKEMIWIMTNQDKDVEEGGFFSLIERREKNEPFEYIVSKVSFYSETFKIDSRSLIPRPETELLVDIALDELKKGDYKDICEVGVGSGVITTMLAKNFPSKNYLALDISLDALSLAKENFELFGVSSFIKLQQNDLLYGIDQNIDLLVSNPPYIADGVSLESNLSYEPQNALFGGKRGDELVLKLIEQVVEKDIKCFICEYGYDQRDSVYKMCEKYDKYMIDFYKDYASLDRGFILKRIDDV